MRTKLFSALFLLFIYSCSVSRKEKAPNQEASQVQKSAFFVSVPITKFSSIQCPCVNVEIGGTTFSMELDLGFRGDLSLSQNLTDQISSKTLLSSKSRYGIQGKEYATKFYRIPTVNIGEMFFIQPVLEEETAEFIKDAVFVQNGREPSPRESGRIGWEFFYNTNLLIDAKHSILAFCDSLETLKKEGYVVEDFVKTPLILERGCVEFDAKTPNGVLRCVLDTGATLNMLHSETAEGDTIDQAIWKAENDLECPSFQINDHDFGPVNFRRVPIKTPIPIGAFIGMEFVKEHLIFLDFSGNYVYFVKHTD